MGNQQQRSESRHSQWSSSSFQQASGIDSGRLSQVQQIFQRAAGADGLISPSEFTRVYQELNLGPYDAASVDRAFRTLDRDRSGKLSFDEFLSATVMLNNNVDPRQRMSYLIDSNHPGGIDNSYITPEYGRTIVHNLNGFYGANADFDEIWTGLNANQGQVRREDFVTYISQAPTFVRYF